MEGDHRPSPSSFFDIEVPFSNKNDTVPPGTSFTISSGVAPMRVMLSKSTASSSDDTRFFDTESTRCLSEEDDLNNKPLRMSSWTRSLAPGRRQLIWVHSPNAASSAFFFFRYALSAFEESTILTCDATMNPGGVSTSILQSSSRVASGIDVSSSSPRVPVRSQGQSNRS